jgi:hypothetical protein
VIGVLLGLLLLLAGWLDLFVIRCMLFYLRTALTEVIFFGLPLYCFAVTAMSAWSLLRNRDDRSAWALLTGFIALVLSLFDILAIAFRGALRAGV